MLTWVFEHFDLLFNRWSNMNVFSPNSYYSKGDTFDLYVNSSQLLSIAISYGQWELNTKIIAGMILNVKSIMTFIIEKIVKYANEIITCLEKYCPCNNWKKIVSWICTSHEPTWNHCNSIGCPKDTTSSYTTQSSHSLRMGLSYDTSITDEPILINDH